MKSDGVGFLDVSYSSMGVTVVTYVLISTGVVLDGDSLLASIQVNNPEIDTSFVHQVSCPRSLVEIISLTFF